MGYNRKYLKKVVKNALPAVSEEERIYLNVPYMAKGVAKQSNCGFDPEKKLWFTGLLNANLHALVEMYGVNDATAERIKELLKEKFK